MLLFMQNTHWRIALHLSQWANSHYLFRFIWQLFSEELIRVNYSNIMFIYRLMLFTPRIIFTFLQILPTKYVLNLVTSLHPHHHKPSPAYSLRWVEFPVEWAFQLHFHLLLHLFSTPQSPWRLFCKEVTWDFDKDYIESVDQFGEYGYPKNIKSLIHECECLCIYLGIF